MHFVSSSIYHKAKQLSLAGGMPSNQFDHHQGVKEVQQGGKYIPITLLLEVYEWAIQNLPPDFSIHQGKQLNPDDYGTLGLSWKTCWQAKDILDRTERFMVLVTDHGSIRMEESNGYTTAYLLRDANRLGVEIANEVSFVMLANIINEVTGKTISPSLVTFKHAARSVAPFNSFFGCQVHFDHQHYSIQYKTDDLNVRTIKADKSIHQFLVERMDEEKRGIHASADQLMGKIHKLIEESLPSGIPSIIQVADYLGMSARTLKRRLSDKGITFRDYVQQIQQEVATDLIRSSARSMAEIAFQTGFSEQSAFNRAFKRWTGQSPADFRKNH
ncbi:MAG: helix-turn-helix domain-containing protein [Cyclobacteriaceae bacterium]|nr:helix-turn-helix domain-containing protein [Cyclobacteriaceae bacterium SS2]